MFASPIPKRVHVLVMLWFLGWHEAYPNDPDFLPTPRLMNQLVAEGKHGVKTGEGFYVYKKK